MGDTEGWHDPESKRKDREQHKWPTGHPCYGSKTLFFVRQARCVWLAAGPPATRWERDVIHVCWRDRGAMIPLQTASKGMHTSDTSPLVAGIQAAG